MRGKVARAALAVAMVCVPPWACASRLWTYVDAQGVTHIGNVAPPPVKRLQWLGPDERVKVRVATRYLADLLRMFEGELELAIAAYNAGEGAVLRHGRRIPPYPETQQYVTRVMRYYRALTGSAG